MAASETPQSTTSAPRGGGAAVGTAASLVAAELNIPYANLVIGVLRSINSTTNTQFVSNYLLDFSGPIGLYISEDFVEGNNPLQYNKEAENELRFLIIHRRRNTRGHQCFGYQYD